MNIFTASDRSNKYGLAALLKSLDLSQLHRVEVFVASYGLTAEDQETLSQCCQFPVHWVEFEPLKGVLSMAGSTLAYAKLQPLKYTTARDRLIWLDSDMIVMDDLQPLATLDLRGRAIAGVRNAEGNPNGIETGAAYLNTGLLVYDLHYWQTYSLTETLLNNSRTHLWVDHDQGAINAVLPGHWLELNPRWNDYHTEDRDTGVIHFISRPKPWEGRDRSQLWFEVFAQTPYRQELSRIQSLPQQASGNRAIVYSSWLSEPFLRLKSFWYRKIQRN